MRAFVLVLGAFIALASASREKKVVCYFDSRSTYRSGNDKFEVSNIDPKLCTHLIYSFVGLTSTGQVRHLDPSNDLPDGGGKANLVHFSKLRQQNPSVKLMVSMGGSTNGSMNFSSVAADNNFRHNMVNSAVQFVRKYNLDGFDLDWQYPAQGSGSSPADKQNFVVLLKELRERFDREGLILSAAVAADEISASKSYDIAAVSRYLHFVNLKTYDLRSHYHMHNYHAALYSGMQQIPIGDINLNVASIIEYWLSEGAPAEKLILGVPFYGRSFTTLGNPHIKGGSKEMEGGTLGYNEICVKLRNSILEMWFDTDRRIPYAHDSNGLTIIYDDVQSLTEKSNFIKMHGLGGAMAWSIDTDDFFGNCGDKYPLLNTLNRELRSAASAPDNELNNRPKYPQYELQQAQSIPDYQDNQSQHQIMASMYI